MQGKREGGSESAEGGGILREGAREGGQVSLRKGMCGGDLVCACDCECALTGVCAGACARAYAHGCLCSQGCLCPCLHALRARMCAYWPQRCLPSCFAAMFCLQNTGSESVFSHACPSTCTLPHAHTHTHMHASSTCRQPVFGARRVVPQPLPQPRGPLSHDCVRARGEQIKSGSGHCGGHRRGQVGCGGQQWGAHQQQPLHCPHG